MHETGTAKFVLAEIEKELKKLRFKKLLRVRIGIGPLSTIDGDHLLEHLREIAPGTAIEGAQLEAVEIPPEYRCRACGQSFADSVIHNRCPKCHSDDVQVERIRELAVLSVDVE
jgi:hydrogenase nickel incorporation protein HypA/HybF